VSAVTGVDGIDIPAATEQTVVIGNAQTEENIIGMAEATVLLVLAALYDLAGAEDRVRQGLWRPPQLPARQLRGKTIGFFGLGKIGREAARLFAPWGAAIQYTARRDADLTGLPPMPRIDLDTLMRTSDVIVVLATLNPETRGLISGEKLRLMKQTAILVNTATRRHCRRGGTGRRAQNEGDRRRRAAIASRSSRCRPRARCAGCRM
jgi:phosphoglycerate dehydrogenase-like enzyme